MGRTDPDRCSRSARATSTHPSAAAEFVSVLLATLLAFAAARKLSHRPAVVESYARVGVPEDRLNQLAALLFLGAAGLLVGLVWAPIGVAAAASLIVYFLLAIAAHVRFGDLANLATPVVIFVLAAAALILRLASA